MSEQMSLAQFNKEFRQPQSQGNRGMDFQAMCDKAHKEYAARGWGYIERHERRWVYTSYQQFQKMPEQARAVVTYTSGRIAHRYLVMQESEVDYSGGLLGRHYEFDCKQFAGKSVRLEMFKRHQVERLVRLERGRCAAGFMVYSSDTGHVFWLKASQVQTAQDRTLYQKKGRGKHPKSFSREWLIENTVQVGIFRIGSPVYWLEALTEGK